MPRVLISPGHYGKPTRDAGAVGVLGEERLLVLRYAVPMALALEAFGWETFITAAGTYIERQAEANRLGVDLFLAPHVNAGGGNYGAVLFDDRSKVGPHLAQAIAGELGSMWPFPHKTWGVGPGDRGFGILDRTKAVALILEPFFTDTKSHVSWAQDLGLEALGEDYALAIHTAWHKVVQA